MTIAQIKIVGHICRRIDRQARTRSMTSPCAPRRFCSAFRQTRSPARSISWVIRCAHSVVSEQGNIVRARSRKILQLTGERADSSGFRVDCRPRAS